MTGSVRNREGRAVEVAAVVGAGVIGSCVVFNLVHRGVHVHCIESSYPGALTTEVSFARLSAVQQPTLARFELSHAGMLAHRHLAQQFHSAPWWHPTGSLAWADDVHSGEPSFADIIARLQAWGYRVEWDEASNVTRDSEPGITFPNSRTPAAARTLAVIDSAVDFMDTAVDDGFLSMTQVEFLESSIHGDIGAATTLLHRAQITALSRLLAQWKDMMGSRWSGAQVLVFCSREGDFHKKVSTEVQHLMDPSQVRTHFAVRHRGCEEMTPTGVPSEPPRHFVADAS